MIEVVKTQAVTPKDEEEHVLVINDTSEMNYNHLNGLFKVNDPDIGLISDNRSTGFFLHPGLAVSPRTGMPLGISSVQTWNRRFGSKTKEERNYRDQPIEEKESYKWLVTARESKAWLAPNSRMTLIGDRENDIFEYFSSIPDQKTDVLVRSSWNRKLTSGLMLTDELELLAWQARVELPVRATEKRTQRTAQLQVKWTSVQIIKPEKRKHLLQQYPDQVKLNVVEVCEHPDSVPQGESPIHWRLFTTHEVKTLEDALLIIKWYRWRWWIEDLFRVLKTEGLEVESSQFSTGLALKKLVVLCLGEALKILTMRQERLGAGNYDASLCFTQDEQAFLTILGSELQGKTQKQQNPHQPQSLAWAVWIIALLGDWIPTDMTKRPPGVITISRGLKKFNQRYAGWVAAINYFQQISNSSP